MDTLTVPRPAPRRLSSISTPAHPNLRKKSIFADAAIASRLTNVSYMLSIMRFTAFGTAPVSFLHELLCCDPKM